MSRWTRTAPLAAASGVQDECWRYARQGVAEQAFDIVVTTGKALDVVGLKNTTLDELRDYAAFLSRTATQLYAADAPRRRVTQCPCCQCDTAAATEILRIFDIAYRRCDECGHAFVGDQPTEESITALFGNSEAHSQTYVDPKTVEIRLQQVIAPKVDWTLDCYRRAFDGDPASCTDVGAGAGHFVEGMRRKGIATDGFELSEASRRFAWQAFGIDLHAADFLTAEPVPVDILTMWGLLEYTPEPRRFLARARRSLTADRGMLIVEVPRFDALGTVAQAANPTAIARHMDPTSHINCFSDSSLATALVEEGFRPVGVWYFGMDAYELLVQAALRLDDEDALNRLADMIPALQASCDAGRQCDDLIVAAVPAP